MARSYPKGGGHRPIGTALLLLCVVLVLAACGSQASGNVSVGSTASQSATPSPTPSPTPVAPTISTALVTYKGHSADVIGVVWSPDGKRLASVSDDATVQEWSATTGQPFWTYTFPNPRNVYLFAIAWSPDGRRIAAAGNTGVVAILDAENGHLLTSYVSQSNFIEGIAWSPDGKRIASGTGSAGLNGPVSSNNSVKVWDAATGQTLQTYARENDEAYALAWSPDGARLAVGGDSRIVQIWEPENDKITLLYAGHNATIFAAAWSPDGKEIASASSDTTVQVWRPEP